MSYIDLDLWDWIEGRCNKAYMGLTNKVLEEILDNCGIWYSLDNLRVETEEFDMTLEDACREYWYVIKNNNIIFVNPDMFSEDLDEFLGL